MRYQQGLDSFRASPARRYAQDAAWQAPPRPVASQQGWRPGELNAEARPSAVGRSAGGIPERAHAFLKTRLTPDDYDAFLKVLKRAANERPVGGSAVTAMDKRMARPGECYYSVASGYYVKPNGVMTTRRQPRALDTSRAEAELRALIGEGAKR